MKHTLLALCKSVLFVILTLLPLAASADWFHGRVVDTETGEAVPFANIETGFRDANGGYYTSNFTADSLGNFYAQCWLQGRYEITASMIGYKKKKIIAYGHGREFADTIEIGDVSIKPDEIMLQEVTVKARARRITMAGDTIVFHPEAFMLKEGSSLADLIKKLPGVQIKDGRPYWNNKPIRLMMNGKDIFGGEGLANQLPAEAVKSIKTYNKASDAEQHTGRSEGTEDQVFDVQVKPGFLDKWYGEVQAAGGNDGHYDGHVKATRLSDKNPMMFFYSMNNINHDYFSDLQQWRTSTLDNFGKQQIGVFCAQHNWITPFGQKQPLQNNVVNTTLLNHSDGWGEKRTTLQTFTGNEVDNYGLTKRSHSYHDLFPKTTFTSSWHPDTLWTINLTANVNYDIKKSHSSESTVNFDSNPFSYGNFPIDEAMQATAGSDIYNKVLSRSRTYETSTDEGLNTEFQGQAWRFFKGKDYLMFTTAFNYSHYNVRSAYNKELQYLREGTGTDFYQYSRKPYHNLYATFNVTLGQWLTKNFQLSCAYQLQQTASTTHRRFYTTESKEQWEQNPETTPEAGNSYDRHDRSTGHFFIANATWNITKDLQLMPGVQFNLFHDRLEYNDDIIDTTATTNYSRWIPWFTMRWKINKNSDFLGSFNYNTFIPSLYDKAGWTDTTNPLFISMGNPALHRYHTHITNLRYTLTIPKKQINTAVEFTYTKNINPLTSIYWYNVQTGVYRTMKANVRGGDMYQLKLNYDQTIGAFSLANQTTIGLSKGYGYLTLTRDDEPLTLNKQRFYSLVEKPSITYTNDWLELKLYYNVNWYNSLYNLSRENNSHLVDYGPGMTAMMHFGPVEIWTQLYDDAHAGYFSSYINRHRPIWNMSADYLFCKKHCAVGFEFFDIFDKINSPNMLITSYQRQESWDNILSQIVLVAFKYKFDAKGDKKKK